MRPRVLAGGLTLAVVVVAAARVASVWSQLPPRFASHFGASGEPDGWTSPAGFVTLFGVIFGAVALLFALGLPALLRRLPASTINLPNRDYWLAPERRAATIERIGEMLAWFGLGITVFAAAVLELSLRANLGGGRMSVAMWPILGVFLAFTIGWLVALYRAFRIPER